LKGLTAFLTEFTQWQYLINRGHSTDWSSK